MIEIKGAIRVNKVRAIAGNIQYTVLLLDDRLVFARTGGSRGVSRPSHFHATISRGGVTKAR